jgi:hypothetical protein
MTSEQYKSTDYLPKGYYPWPDIINPHVVQMGKDMDSWIDNDYTFLTEKQREKYKKMRLHACTARTAPHASYEQVIPCNRFLLFHVVMDDQLEHFSPAENEQLRERLTAILRGDDPRPDENALYHQMALLRDEHKAYMPAEWMERYAESFYRTFRYGIEVETPYKAATSPPPLVLFKAIREYSVLMYSYLDWAEIQTGFTLPNHLAEHPIIQRFRALTSRVIAWQNDFHSLQKEMAKQTEVFNLILVLQHEYNISLEEACAEAKRIHDEDVAEFIALHKTFQGFGVYQEQVDRYVFHLGLMMQGVNSFYMETERYLPGGVGFAWPEHATVVDKS